MFTSLCPWQSGDDKLDPLQEVSGKPAPWEASRGDIPARLDYPPAKMGITKAIADKNTTTLLVKCQKVP